ncbi:hypothetical protein ACRRTK_024094 [Alexandromys fortis]
MNRPLTASAEAEEELEWQVASRRRKAWAKCRSSWQASETEDLSTEATTQDEDEDDEEDLPGAKLPAAAGRGRFAGTCGRGGGVLRATGRWDRTTPDLDTRASSAPSRQPMHLAAGWLRRVGRPEGSPRLPVNPGGFFCKGVSGWHSL